LKLLERRGFPDPLELQVLHVRRSDLLEPAVALIRDGAGIAETVCRLALGVQDPLERDLGAQRRCAEQCEYEQGPSRLHRVTAPAETTDKRPGPCSACRSASSSPTASANPRTRTRGGPPC